MAQRIDLQDLLEGLLESGNVYFQPPPNVQMNFPCIIYERHQGVTNHADNFPYRRLKRYQVTVVDRDPDSDIPDKVAELPTCIFDRHYAVDGLNHDVYLLFF